MKSTWIHCARSCAAGLVAVIMLCGGTAEARHTEPAHGAMWYGTEGDFVTTNIWLRNTALLALNEKNTPDTPAVSKGWNWHKTLGLGTLITAASTVISGFTGHENAHCHLAALSTGLAAVTCVNGFYTYGNVFAYGDTGYTVHAVAGMLATLGFGASCALADGAPHGEIGAASGMLFLLTVGVLHF